MPRELRFDAFRTLGVANKVRNDPVHTRVKLSRWCGDIICGAVGRSSNGRTADSGSASGGSSPPLPAKMKRPLQVEGSCDF